MSTTDDEKFVPLLNKFRASCRLGKHNIDEVVLAAKQNFVTSPLLANEIFDLSEKENYVFRFEDMRLPYPSIFVELPATKEMLAKTSAEQKFDPTKQIYVKRSGAFISTVNPGETYDNGGFYFWPVWETTDGIVRMSELELLISDKPSSKTFEYGINKNSPNLNIGTMPSPVLRDMVEDSGVDTATFMQSFSKHQNENSDIVLQAAAMVPPLLCAWSALINCKTGVTKTAVRQFAPSGAGKRLKALADRNYTVLSLSAVESVSPAGHTTPRRDVNAHYVRGHFKQRASGIYWWQPFVRGRGPVKRRDAYFATV